MLLKFQHPKHAHVHLFIFSRCMNFPSCYLTDGFPPQSSMCMPVYNINKKKNKPSLAFMSTPHTPVLPVQVGTVSSFPLACCILSFGRRGKTGCSSKGTNSWLYVVAKSISPGLGWYSALCFTGRWLTSYGTKSDLMHVETKQGRSSNANKDFTSNFKDLL